MQQLNKMYYFVLWNVVMIIDYKIQMLLFLPTLVELIIMMHGDDRQTADRQTLFLSSLEVHAVLLLLGAEPGLDVLHEAVHERAFEHIEGLL